MAARDELVAAVTDRYARGDRGERGRILDEFAAVTGYHRKRAMRVLRAGQVNRRWGPRPGRRIYDDAVREVLILIWEASDRICGKRLRPLLPIFVEAMERHGHLQLAPEVRVRLLAMSAATIDRALRDIRRQAGTATRRRSAPSAAIRRSVPVRTFDDWDDPPPGFVEADLVAHSGPVARGSFVQTLVLTDIATGWTECAAAATGTAAADRGTGRITQVAALPLARAGHRQRQRVHERDRSGLLPAGRDRVHPLPSLSQNRPSLGRAEEWRCRAPDNRPSAFRGPGSRSGANPPRQHWSNSSQGCARHGGRVRYARPA